MRVLYNVLILIERLYMQNSDVKEIVTTLGDQGFLSFDDEITVDDMTDLVMVLLSSSETNTMTEVVEMLFECGHLHIDDDQLEEVCELAESLVP